jgi:hypothetical protein
VTEVSNVQHLVRELILRCTAHWRVVTEDRPLEGTIDEWVRTQAASGKATRQFGTQAGKPAAQR